MTFTECNVYCRRLSFPKSVSHTSTDKPVILQLVLSLFGRNTPYILNGVQIREAFMTVSNTFPP